ncbi:MAG TPA: hypothetical protein VFE65_27220 [Pseudonocardia sp.]|jgi:hypothetical protein|nr:hypothetical protein [Pseudonocardia sp.]
MGDTAKQAKHEVEGIAEKAAGAVTGSDKLHEKGDEHLEEAAELEHEWDKSRVGALKDSDGRGVLDK